MIEQTKFTYSPLGKALEKQTKGIEDQGEKQIKATEEHGKQLVESNALVKEMVMIVEIITNYFWKKKIYIEFVAECKNEVNTLSEKIKYNDLT